MKEISLTELLEAGCHFGHRVQRWHPKAAPFIYQAREGIHIIDLAKTRDGLSKAAVYLKQLGMSGKTVLFVATKRQARSIVRDAARKAGVYYLINRWIGGFMTNWNEVKKNIDKYNRLYNEKTEGKWQGIPKHEVSKLSKYLRRLDSVYGGVASLTNIPEAIFIIDIKKEISALREAKRSGVTTVAIVDTNTDPVDVDYPIPANDDAVGSIQYITDYLIEAYIEGRELFNKGLKKAEEGKQKPVVAPVPVKEKTQEAKKEEKAKKPKTERPVATPKPEKADKTGKPETATQKKTGEVKKKPTADGQKTAAEAPKKKRGRPKKAE